MKRFLTSAVCLAVLAFILGLYAWQAAVTPTFPFDEPLWFMRSRVPPADLSRPEYRYWSIDIPALNRWTYYCVLKATGLDAVPEDEPRAWHTENSALYFGSVRLPNDVGVRRLGAAGLARWEEQHGPYAPRKAVMAMRMVNVAVYGVLLVCLWWTARLALRSWGLSLIAVLPMTVIPLFAMRLAFASASGDVHFMAAAAAALAVWMYFHLKGSGASLAAVAAVSIALGVATGSKHLGLLVLASYWLYLVLYARGRRKLLAPLASGALAFVVFGLIDPIVFIDPSGPVRVCLEMIGQRVIVSAAYVKGHGPLSWTNYSEQVLFWWPLAPAVAFLAWHSRRQPWFPPLALWGGVLVFGTLAGLAHARMMSPHYLAPLELGLYFPVALMVIAAARAAVPAPAKESAGPGQS